MKKIIIFGVSAIGLGVYFVMTLFFFPGQIMQLPQTEPHPIHEVELSDSEISLGESFRISIKTTNQNDYADFLITSVGFASIQEISEDIQVVGYDFTRAPNYIAIGDLIGTKYNDGKASPSENPSIEAYSLNVRKDATHNIELEITPQSSGIFEMHVKSIAFPHVSEKSHYPQDGHINFQEEFVDVYEMAVKP